MDKGVEIMPVCAPGDVLKNVFVRETQGQYLIYVRSGGYEIPVSYTNRRLTTITPISALLGLTIMGVDPKKITDPAEYKKLYDAVKGVLSVIQDEMLYMRGKANYAIMVDGESVCLPISRLKFLLEQVQDRYLINLVRPEVFKPGLVEAPTKIPERYKIGIPVEVGAPAEIPAVKIPEVKKPTVVPAAPTEPVLRAEIEKALAEIEQQKAIATTAGLTDLASRMQDIINWYRSRLAKTEEIRLRDPEAALRNLQDIRDSVVKQVESYRDHLARRIGYAKLPEPELEKLREMARKAGFWDLAAKLGELIERAPPAPAVPAVEIPRDVESSIDRALSLLRRADSLIAQIEKKRDECIRKGGTVSYTAVSALERLKSQTASLKSRVKSLQDIIARATGVTPVAAAVPAATALEEKFTQIKAAVSKARAAVPRVQLKRIEVSPIPESVFADFQSVLVEAMKVQICILPKVPTVPKPPVAPPVPVVPVKLAVWKPFGFTGLKARVIAPPGANVTVYWSTCPLWGGCATTISELKRRGKSKSAKISGLYFADFTLESYFAPLVSYVYAFAEVRYKDPVTGKEVLTQTPVVTGGGPLGVTISPPAPPAPTYKPPTAPGLPGLPTTPTPPGLPG